MRKYRNQPFFFYLDLRWSCTDCYILMKIQRLDWERGTPHRPLTWMITWLINREASRYISCSRSLEAVRRFAGQQQQIVRIEIHGNNPNIQQIIDLTDPATFNMLIHNQTGRNFANAFQEVLIEGFIPPECISVVPF